MRDDALRVFRGSPSSSTPPRTPTRPTTVEASPLSFSLSSIFNKMNILAPRKTRLKTPFKHLSGNDDKENLPNKSASNNATPEKPLAVAPEVNYYLIDPNESDTYVHNGTTFLDWLKAHEMLKIYKSLKWKIGKDDPPVLFKVLPRNYVIDLQSHPVSDDISQMFILQQSPGACVLLCTLQVASWIRMQSKLSVTLPSPTEAYCKFLLPNTRDKITAQDVDTIRRFVKDYREAKPSVDTFTTTDVGGDNMHFHTTALKLLPETACGKERQMRETARDANTIPESLDVSLGQLVSIMSPGDFGCVLVAHGTSRHGLSLFATSRKLRSGKYAPGADVVVHVFDSWNQTRSELNLSNKDNEDFGRYYEGLWGKDCLNSKVFEHCIYADAGRKEIWS